MYIQHNLGFLLKLRIFFSKKVKKIVNKMCFIGSKAIGELRRDQTKTRFIEGIRYKI